MEILFEESFQKDLLALDKKDLAQAAQLCLKLPKQLGNMHQHHGMGIRKLHTSGIYEARLGLKLRLIFSFSKEVLTFHRLGTHDEIQRFLKRL